jgi:hypothetical protein
LVSFRQLHQLLRFTPHAGHARLRTVRHFDSELKETADAGMIRCLF